MPLEIPVLTAPTAAGKTALALELAQIFPIEIVAADAFTVYRGMDIGTAKPSRAEMQAAAHHLIDVADVTESFSVTQYVGQAEDAIGDIVRRGKIPIIVGGTGFYISALFRGLPVAPTADRQIQSQIKEELERSGLDHMLGYIEAHNPAEAAKMERNPRRIIRAIEVLRRTGKLPNELGYKEPKYKYRIFSFSPEMEQLEDVIRQRTRQMLRQGWQSEAMWLAEEINPNTMPRPTAWQAIGYLEALALARLEITEAEALASIELATRQYTKRQLTWIRNQLGANVLSREELAAEIKTYLSTLC